MSKPLKAYLFVFVIYVVLYVNYFVENDNIRNITITLLWINTLLFSFAAFGSLYSKDKSKNNSINKVIIRILLFFVPVVMIYFGDIFMGLIYGISLIMIFVEINKEKNRFIRRQLELALKI